MSSSSVQSFDDPEAYAASVRATRYELTVTGRGQFAAERTRIDLHSIWMQRFSSNLPFVAHSASMSGRAFFIFRTDPGPDLLLGAAELQRNAVVRFAEDQSTFQRAAGPVSWGAMSLPVDVVAAVSEAIIGRDLTPPRDAVLTLLPTPAMARLQRLHAAAGYLARHAPEIIANHTAALGLEQQLIEAIAAGFGEADDAQDRAARPNHGRIMRRFHEAVEASGEEAVYLAELCSTIGVSGRTLRSCCQEHLGMSPLRYLWLRRMQMARTALTRANRASASVTEIATAQGFWELGRFAVAYRRLYGESPSATLARN